MDSPRTLSNVRAKHEIIITFNNSVKFMVIIMFYHSNDVPYFIN